MPFKETLTEKNLPDQTGKVFIVTGATSGVGKELAQILYQHNARVYLAARDSQKATDTIQWLKSNNSSSKGEVKFLHLDLADLTTIAKSAQEFLAQETKLDVLWNNAGVMAPPQGSQTKQGFEMQLGVNNVGTFLFTKLLTPVLEKNASSAPPGSIRVVWVASSAAERFSPKGGVDMSNLDYHNDKGPWHKYGVSKAGNILHGKEFARRNASSGIVSVALDPGNLKTDLYRHLSWWQRPIVNLILKEPVYGAYTELYAGLSDNVTVDDNGAWIEPWGKIKRHNRADIESSCHAKGEADGTGIASDFWDWTEEQVKQYV